MVSQYSRIIKELELVSFSQSIIGGTDEKVNIDNVVHEGYQEVVIDYKKVLGAILIIYGVYLTQKS